MKSKRFAAVFTVLTIGCLSTAIAPVEAEELAKIPIKPGTALAKLVSETTPRIALFHLTSKPSKLDIPDWLRAHYLRNHTELRTAAKPEDPTGGLPMALEDLYVWMLHNQNLQPPAAPPSVPVTRAVSVGNNLLISGQQSTPRSESDIRINPENAKQIIAASNNIGNGRQAQFFSGNGGVSWGQTTLPLRPGDSMHSDPTVDWTSDGTAWATTIGISAGSTVLQMRAYFSKDGGKTWTFDSTFSGQQTNTDKQMMWVDHSTTSSFRNNIYVIWHNAAPAFIARRTSEGWQPPIQVSGAETTGTSIGSDITTNSAGDVFAAWPDTGTQNLFIVKSSDGGASFSEPRPIAKTFGSFQVRIPAFAERAALIGVSIAAFRDSNHNDVYLSWVDLSGEAGCNVPDNEPFHDVSSPCKSRIWFTRSTDGGTSWDPPQKINDSALRSDQFNHKLAVDPATGTLGIVYYDTAANSVRKKTNLMFQASVDGGQHWSSPATKVTSAMTDETTGKADGGNQYGDYNGLSVVGGLFCPSWTDRRKNVSEQIFTARITVTKDQTGNIFPSLGEERTDGTATGRSLVVR